MVNNVKIVIIQKIFVDDMFVMVMKVEEICVEIGEDIKVSILEEFIVCVDGDEVLVKCVIQL